MLNLKKIINWIDGKKNIIQFEDEDEEYTTEKEVNLDVLFEMAINFICYYEGRYLTKDKNLHRAYLDPIYIWTVGYGHVFLNKDGKMYGSSKCVKRNIEIVDNFENLPQQMQFITEDEALDFLTKNIKQIYNSIEKKVKEKLNQNQLCAIISFIYNLGYFNFKRSTLRRLIISDIFEKSLITSAFIRFSNAGGQHFYGLKKRRLAEAKLFLT